MKSKSFKGRVAFFKLFGIPVWFKVFKNQEQAKVWSKK